MFSERVWMVLKSNRYPPHPLSYDDFTVVRHVVMFVIVRRILLANGKNRELNKLVKEEVNDVRYSALRSAVLNAHVCGVDALLLF